MRALFFDGSAVQFRTAYPDPVPARDAVLVKVRLAGLCQTDLEIVKGYMGFKGVLGHEFVGSVAALGPGVDPVWLGQRVVGEINCVCGACPMCTSGLSTHCLKRTVIGILNHDGAFADLLRLPVRNLHTVPDHVTDEEAVFTEPLAAAFQILRQVPVDKRTRAIVLGDGRLGLLVAQVLQRTACRLTLLGRHPDKLALADRRGIRTALDADFHGPRDHDIVVDCTGRPQGFARALALVRPRGTIVLKTTVASPAASSLHLAQIVIDEITVLGSRCGPFPDALAALAAREVDVLPLISRRVPLDQAEPLFRSIPSGIKTLLRM